MHANIDKYKFQDQVGWSPEQLSLVGDIRAHGSRLGTR